MDSADPRDSCTCESAIISIFRPTIGNLAGLRASRIPLVPPQLRGVERLQLEAMRSKEYNPLLRGYRLYIHRATNLRYIRSHHDAYIFYRPASAPIGS